MVRTIGAQIQNRDWAVLKVVVAALWVAAGFTFLIVRYAAPPQEEIVLSTGAMPAKQTVPMHLAGSAAR